MYIYEHEEEICIDNMTITMQKHQILVCKKMRNREQQKPTK